MEHNKETEVQATARPLDRLQMQDQAVEQCTLASQCDARSHRAEAHSSNGTAGLQANNGSSEYLCYFVHRFLSFRNAEIDALAAANGVPDVCWREPAGRSQYSPFWYLRLPSDDIARKIAERSMLLKSFFELWGEGSSFEAMAEQLRRVSQAQRERYGGEGVSWKIVVDKWGAKLRQSEQIALINKLAFLGFTGPIDLESPEVTFRLISTSSRAVPGMPLGITPDHWYFGREVAVSNRHIIAPFLLPKRVYIGPTSMDTEMAFVMCSMAKVKKSHLVFDPFVGTGSILVAAAYYGAVTLGADIDAKVVKDGKPGPDGQNLDVWSNFRQYGLTPPAGLLRLDAHVPAFRHRGQGFLDSILCDPPYGVRAGGRRSLCRSETGVSSEKGLKWALAENGYPGTQGYSLTECLSDLLGIAARTLCLGGRLVYFLPAAPGTCEGGDVPQHPTLRLVSNCEQVLTSRYSRRLITMEKAKHFDPEEEVPAIDPQIEAHLIRLSQVVWESREGRPERAKHRGKLT